MKTISIETNESAVSEVIGIVLMVALTVIMAAILTSMAMGMMQSVPMPRVIAVTADQSPDRTQMYVTYHGGPDHDDLLSLTINWPDGITQQTVTSPKVNDMYIATNGAGPQNVTSGNDRLMVIGHFPHNEDQVLLDTWI